MSVRKKTNSQFLKEIDEMYGGEYIPLTEYVNNKTKVEVKHAKCGFIWGIKPNHLLQGKKCPKCAGNLPLTTEILKQTILERLGEDYSLQTDYVSIHKKVLIKHSTCGFEYEITPNRLRSKPTSNSIESIKCPACNTSGNIFTFELLTKRLELSNLDYSVVQMKVDNKNRVLFKHSCGYEFVANATDVLTEKHGCAKCSNRKISKTQS